MDRDTELILITPVMAADTYGIPQEGEPIRRSVFARVESVSRSEFFEAGRNGLRPDYKMTMFSYDYEGEKIVEFNGRRFNVVRAFQSEFDVKTLILSEVIR